MATDDRSTNQFGNHKMDDKKQPYRFIRFDSLRARKVLIRSKSIDFIYSVYELHCAVLQWRPQMKRENLSEFHKVSEATRRITMRNKNWHHLPKFVVNASMSFGLRFRGRPF